MKILVCVGSVCESKLPKHDAGIHCDDYEDLLECLQDSNDGHEYVVIVGNNVFKKAFWNEYGCYGDIINDDDIVIGIKSVFKDMEVIIQ